MCMSDLPTEMETVPGGKVADYMVFDICPLFKGNSQGCSLHFKCLQ
jgi:hypothetical protein